MTTHQLDIILSVCESCSMTEAAKKCYISQPAISSLVQKFEKEHGISLFMRSNRTLHLTDEGKNALAYLKQIRQLLSDMELSITESKKQQTLRIGSGISFGEFFLPRIIRTFQDISKECKLHLVINTGPTIEKLVNDYELDLGIIESPSNSIDLQHTALSHSSLVAICHSSHPLAEKKVVTAQMLSQYPLLLRDPGSQTRSATELLFSNNNLAVFPLMESDSARALLNAAHENLGVAILPLDHYIFLKIPDLTPLKIQDFDFHRYIDFIYPKKTELSPIALKFIEFASNYIQAIGYESITL